MLRLELRISWLTAGVCTEASVEVEAVETRANDAPTAAAKEAKILRQGLRCLSFRKSSASFLTVGSFSIFRLL